MTLEGVAGRTYGPFPLRCCAEKVAELVEATGDDESRWVDFAPPSFAALALFAAAPVFLSDPDVATPARSVIHGDQLFRWHRPWLVEGDHAVRARVDKVRSRGEMVLVTFEVTVDESGGGRVLESTSTFLLSAAAVVGTLPSAEEAEPDASRRAQNDRPVRASLPDPGQALEPLRKSASRADLVRYAAATRDWNPIHWDHGAAVAAGLQGVVCHGLLMAAWLTQLASRYTPSERPLVEARLRFRHPLRPAVQAEVLGEVAESRRLKLAVLADGVERVAAAAELA